MATGFSRVAFSLFSNQEEHHAKDRDDDLNDVRQGRFLAIGDAADDEAEDHRPAIGEREEDGSRDLVGIGILKEHANAVDQAIKEGEKQAPAVEQKLGLILLEERQRQERKRREDGDPGVHVEHVFLDGEPFTRDDVDFVDRAKKAVGEENSRAEKPENEPGFLIVFAVKDDWDEQSEQDEDQADDVGGLHFFLKISDPEKIGDAHATGDVE